MSNYIEKRRRSGEREGGRKRLSARLAGHEVRRPVVGKCERRVKAGDERNDSGYTRTKKVLGGIGRGTLRVFVV